MVKQQKRLWREAMRMTKRSVECLGGSTSTSILDSRGEETDGPCDAFASELKVGETAIP